MLWRQEPSLQIKQTSGEKMTRAYDSIGEIIRDTLIEKKECYGLELYREVQKQMERKISLDSFRKNYLYKMERLGLIERSRLGERPQPHLKPRQYWKIVRGKKDQILLWRYPQVEYEERFRRKQK